MSSLPAWDRASRFQCQTFRNPAYFDGFKGEAGVFGLQYDATGSPNGFSSKPLLPTVPLKGSDRWLTNRFHVRDGRFQNSQNARSDFRLWASPPELNVSRVTVTREPDAPMQGGVRFDMDSLKLVRK